MTPTQINGIFILLILAALALMYIVMRHVQKWLPWLVPIFVLLLHGLVYSIFYIIDASNGVTNPQLYNGWNNVLRGQTYLTVIAYIVAFLDMMRRFNKHG